MNSKKEKYLWHFLTSTLYIFLLLLSILFFYIKGKIPTEISVFDFLILGLATFRLTYLFVNDAVMDFLRDYFGKFERGVGKSISELITCPWCVGIWIALLVGFLYFLSPLAWFFFFILALAGLGTFAHFLSSLFVKKANS